VLCVIVNIGRYHVCHINGAVLYNDKIFVNVKKYEIP